jgi:hypothetical protein
MGNTIGGWPRSSKVSSFGVLVRTAKGYLPAPFGGWLYSALEKVPAIARIRAKNRNFIRDKTLSRLSLETDRRDFTA